MHQTPCISLAKRELSELVGVIAARNAFLAAAAPTWHTHLEMRVAIAPSINDCVSARLHVKLNDGVREEALGLCMLEVAVCGRKATYMLSNC